MNRVFYFCFLFFLLFIQAAKADNLYSLIKKFRGYPDDTSKVNLELRIIDLYILYGKYDSASIEIYNALNLSEKLHYSYGTASALCAKGIIQYNQSQYGNSIILFDSAGSIFLSAGDVINEIKCLNNKAKALNALDKYKEALALLKIAEKKALEISDKNGLGYCYYIQGSVLNDRGEYIEASAADRKSVV